MICRMRNSREESHRRTMGHLLNGVTLSVSADRRIFMPRIADVHIACGKIYDAQPDSNKMAGPLSGHSADPWYPSPEGILRSYRHTGSCNLRSALQEHPAYTCRTSHTHSSASIPWLHWGFLHSERQASDLLSPLPFHRSTIWPFCEVTEGTTQRRP